MIRFITCTFLKEYSLTKFFLVYLVVLFLNNVVFHFIETIFFSYTLYPKYISFPLLLPVPSYIPFLPDTLPLIRKRKKNWLWKDNS